MPIAVGQTPHPHLPPPLGVLSEWQRTVRDHPLLNAGKDEPLPESADVVIVGSGMCGESLVNARVARNSLGRSGDSQLVAEGAQQTEACGGPRSQRDLFRSQWEKCWPLSSRPI